MKRYSADLILKARQLRLKEKLSLAELGKRINVPANTVGTWFKEPAGNRWDALIIANENKRKEFKKSEVFVVPNVRSLSRNQATFLAGILYGCEGSKYPSSNVVAFANSDPKLIATFTVLLRKSFTLDENKFHVHLQIHSSQNFEKLKKYWSELLGLPKICFIKPTITTPKGKKHRDKYMGTCTLRYSDYRIQLKLLGIFENFTSMLAIQK